MIQNTQPNRPMTPAEAYNAIHQPAPTATTAPAEKRYIRPTYKHPQHTVQIPDTLADQIRADILNTAKNNQPHTTHKALQSTSKALANQMLKDETLAKAQHNQTTAKQQRAEAQAKLTAESNSLLDTTTTRGTQKPSHIISQSGNYTILKPIGSPYSRINVNTLADEVALTATAIATLGNHHGWLEAIETANRLSTEHGQENAELVKAERKQRASRAKAQAQNIRVAKASRDIQRAKADRPAKPQYKRRKAISLPSSQL